MLGIPTYLLFELTLIAGRFMTLPEREEDAAADAVEYNVNSAGDDGIYEETVQHCYHRRKKRRNAPVPKRKPRK